MRKRSTHPNSIVRFRGLRGWKLTDLAQISRIDEWTLRHLETGKNEMHAGHMHRLSTVFQCTVEALLQPCVSRRNPQQSRKRSINNLNKGRGAPRYAGKLSVPDDAPELVRDLYGLMNEQKLLVGDVAAGSGVSTRAISDWRYRRSPTRQSFEAVLNNFGYRLQIVEQADET